MSPLPGPVAPVGPRTSIPFVMSVSICVAPTYLPTSSLGTSPSPLTYPISLKTRLSPSDSMANCGAHPLSPFDIRAVTSVSPSTVMALVVMVPALRMSFPPMSKSADISFGTTPLRDTASCRASSSVSKLSLMAERLYPPPTLSNVTSIAITSSFYYFGEKQLFVY